jgi:glycosyltransferase involved in cell wall biosynthesis
MRILMLHDRYVIRGGEDESTDAEVELLRQHNDEVDLLEADNHIITTQNPVLTSFNAIWSTEAHRLVTKQLKQKKYDVVHIQNFFPLFSPSVLHAAHSSDIPTVQALRNYRLLCLNGLFYRQHHNCEDCIGRIPLPGIIHRCYRNNLGASFAVGQMLTVHRLLRTWHNQVDLFYTLSNFAYQKLIEGGVPKNKLVVKPNFVSPDPRPGPNQRKYMVLVGRLVEEKGVLTVLEAWQKLQSRVPLKIVGDGPLVKYVLDAIRESPEIQYLGKKNLSDVYEILGNALAVIFPTQLYETFGRVIIEAYAKQTPVIASRIGTASSLVLDGKTGMLFSPTDARELSQKVDWAWNHPEEMIQMGQNARKEFENKYTAEQNYQMLIDIYRQAIENHRSNKMG